MAEKTTKSYSNTFSGSVGAGMGSIFNPSGRKYYILEHKIASKYHKLGENQEIIIDRVELGRDSHCQVRFDESFKTVSRRHAAIVRDGDNWKLIQLSNTNTTFLNGRPVKSEWYLQNGDEIQLSVNGPKLGFIVPTGNKSTVKSIGLSRRLSLFRQQALRPYKTAIAIITIFMCLSIGGLGTWSYFSNKKHDKEMASALGKLNELQTRNDELNKLVSDAAKERKRLDSLIKSRPIVKAQNNAGGLQKFEDDIFKIYACVYAIYQGEYIPMIKYSGDYLGWNGTGFLLNDGRFVTAKHCIECWKYENEDNLFDQAETLKDEDTKLLFLAGLTGQNGVKLCTRIIAKSPTKQIEFYSEQFKFTTKGETKHSFWDDDELTIIKSTLDDGTDWAYANTDLKGSITGDASLSNNLPAGAKLEVLGYPRGMSAEGGSCLYGSCQTSSRGLHNGVILISGKNFEPGNSGGPVFYNDNGIYKAVGIVSYIAYDSMGGLIPLCNLN